jgi:hypothetical protein
MAGLGSSIMELRSQWRSIVSAYRGRKYGMVFLPLASSSQIGFGSETSTLFCRMRTALIACAATCVCLKNTGIRPLWCHRDKIRSWRLAPDNGLRNFCAFTIIDSFTHSLSSFHGHLQARDTSATNLLGGICA